VQFVCFFVIRFCKLFFLLGMPGCYFYGSVQLHWGSVAGWVSAEFSSDLSTNARQIEALVPREQSL